MRFFELPGDTFQIQTSKVARLQTLITPVMDNLYLDTYYFFVPNRLVWEHWEEFCGANKTSAWYPQVQYAIPEMYSPDNGWIEGTIADYFGIPTHVETGAEGQRGINALPFRAYALICEEWFRDENLMDPLVIPKGDSTVLGVNTGNYVTDTAKGGLPFIACKFHDYFTSCLPAPQKGPDVSFLDGYAQVRPMTTAGSTFDGLHELSNAGLANTTIRFKNSGNLVDRGYVLGTMNPAGSGTGIFAAGVVDDPESVGTGMLNTYQAYFSNLFADLSTARTTQGAFTTSINQLRLAFQIQRLLERDARGGTRYIELLKAHFGVTSPDSRLQRPEYLGGNRVPFNIEQVLQTSSTDSTTPQGNVAGWSQTNDTHFDVEKSFVEHGYIIGLMCARYDHSYQQGLERMWSRATRFDFYYPALAHIGEKAVMKGEIYWDGVNHLTTMDTSEVFGYQEAWAEYRYKPNYITGQMRSAYSQSLDFWHFADYYDSKPTLSAPWIVEDKANVDRTLAVTSAVANQIFMDIFVSNKCTRPMPLYSIPGLIDHF